MSDVLIRIIVAVCRMFGARIRLLAKPAQDPNNTQSAMRVGLLAGFVKLRDCCTHKARLVITAREQAFMDPSEISALIEAGLPNAVVSVQSPDNTHFEAVVVAEAFDGKRALQRHQLVYKCLGTLMGNEIHAMSIRAHTPEEWRELESAGRV